MQATITTNRRFGFNRFGSTLVALGIVAGIVIGAAGSAGIDDLPTVRSSGSAIILPKAHSSLNQGEGMLAGTADVTAAIRAYPSIEQGEGVVGGNLVVSSPLIAHTSLGQGDGVLGGFSSDAALLAPVVAYDSVGMREGWAAYGRP